MMYIRFFYTCLLLGFLSARALSQDLLEQAVDSTAANEHEKVTGTFKSTRLINGHSIETLYKHDLEFRVDHRFGDIAGTNGGTKTFYGLDQSTDIRIGFDYGVTDRFTVAIARAKGATAVTQLYELSLKYRLLSQTADNHVPLSITLFGSSNVSGVKASDDQTSPASFRRFNNRLAYVSQAIIARKFSDAFSFELTPSYLHYNYTAFGDQNDLFALGIGGRLKISKRMALVADYYLPFRDGEKKDYLESVNGKDFYNALGVGMEIETGGHVFHMNFTNATGIEEQQFISQTTSSWLKGQFRWGFSISRRFTL